MGELMRENRKRNDYIKSSILCFTSISDKMTENRLKWFEQVGHVEKGSRISKNGKVKLGWLINKR